MFNAFKKRLKKRNEAVLITIHGFGVHRSHEMDDFLVYANQYIMETVAFDLFDLENNQDDDYSKWIQRAEDRVHQALNEHKKIYLLGFSMGGVIASYLASKYNIEKLILISPAFIHFNIENYTNIAIKTGKKIFSSGEQTTISMPKSFYSAFINCIKDHKNDIKQVKCPVLLIQGDQDEIIPLKSSEWAYEQLNHDQKQCIFLHEGKHRILQDEHVQKVAFLLIDDFLHERLLPLQNKL